MQCLCNKGLNIKERDLEIGEWYEEGNDFGEHSEVYKKNAVWIRRLEMCATVSEICLGNLSPKLLEELSHTFIGISSQSRGMDSGR